MYRRFSVVILLAAVALPSYAPAAVSKEILELQRDMADLQNKIQQLQQSQDKRFAELLPIVQQALDSANHANTAIAAIQTGLQQSLRTQEEKVVTPVVGLSTRMDGLTQELRTTEQNITDLSSQLSKIMASLDDMKNAIKVIQTPPAPPPVLDSDSASQPGAGQPITAIPAGGGQPAASPGGTPPMSQVDMYNHARADYEAGNNDFALTEFADYLKYFPATPLASNSQFYIGMIHYAKGDFETAAKDFDLVVEKYPENANKNPDARYYKGMSLLRANKPTAADTEFRELILHHPRTQMADQACKRIEELGKHCPTPPPAGKKGGRKE
jgi:TolA-binding protein